MSRNKFLYVFLFFIVCPVARAKVFTDTIESRKEDRVIITYDMVQEDGRTVIRFMDAKKKIGRTYRDKYKKLDDVAVVFFDRVVSHDDMKFTGLAVNAFNIPSNISYNHSDDGYFLLKDKPTISFGANSLGNTMLEIPIYLAHYEGKKHYRVFSLCGHLKVKLQSKKQVIRSVENIEQEASRIVTSIEEIESGLSKDEEEALKRIETINELLGKQEQLPFTGGLDDEVSMLRDLKYRVTNEEITQKIKETINAYDNKKEELKEKAEREAQYDREMAEFQAKVEAELEQARLDSIQMVEQKKVEEKERRNLWMIVGGMAFAALCFVGNQVFQHFRNIKNQKSMMEMQQSVVKQAETEAKRRAQNAARSQTNKVLNETRRKGRDIVRNNMPQSAKNLKNKNKGISI